MTEKVNSPDKLITISINGESKEFKMYYGLLNELVGHLNDLSKVGDIYTDTDTRNKVLVSILSPRDKNGKRIGSDVGPEDIDVEYEDIESLLSWAASHVTAFFIRNLVRLTDQIQAIPGATVPVENPSTYTSNGSES